MASMSSGPPAELQGHLRQRLLRDAPHVDGGDAQAERLRAARELEAAGAVADDRQQLAVQAFALRLVIGTAGKVGDRLLVASGE